MRAMLIPIGRQSAARMRPEETRSDDVRAVPVRDITGFLNRAESQGYKPIDVEESTPPTKVFTHPYRKCEASLVQVHGSWILFRASKELRSACNGRTEHERVGVLTNGNSYVDAKTVILEK